MSNENLFPEENDGIGDLVNKKPSSKPSESKRVDEIIFYSHSQIFYYWPIWLASLIFAAITWTTGTKFHALNSSGEAIIKNGTQLKTMMVGSPTLWTYFPRDTSQRIVFYLCQFTWCLGSSLCYGYRCILLNDVFFCEANLDTDVRLDQASQYIYEFSILSCYRSFSIPSLASHLSTLR